MSFAHTTLLLHINYHVNIDHDHVDNVSLYYVHIYQGLFGGGGVGALGFLPPPKLALLS